MKKKKGTRLSRVNRYLYKNSYFYKWGKQIWRSRIGRTLVLLVAGLLIMNTGYGILKNHQVKRFLLNWQAYQNNQQYEEFIRCIDQTPENPDRISFPDWKGQFFDQPIRMNLKDISVERVKSGFYRAEMEVIFLMKEKTENRFQGIVFVRENGSFRIVRVEI